MPAARRIGKIVAVTVAAASLCLAAAGCGSVAGPGGRSEEARTLGLARAQFSRAAAALLAGDPSAFAASLPLDEGASSAGDVRKSLDEIFATLSRLPWRTFSFEVTPAGSTEGVYKVRGSGQLGDAGPPDRIAVVRYLKLAGVADGVSIVADDTPGDVRRRYLMALHDPVVLQRPGLIVLADRWAHGRAAAVMAAAARARPRLAALGIGTRPTVLVTVYGSVEDVRDALGVDATAARLAFFAHSPLRAADASWPVLDVAVMGPWLRDLGVSMDDTLTHELAHAYTVQWFDAVDDPPSLLLEGIAQAAEGSPQSPALREEVVSGEQLWPLPESFSVADVWEGADAEGVGLGYDVGGSLVSYVASRWGPGKVRRFVQAVAAAEPTEAGMDEALGGVLGVTWAEFHDGWRRYVLSGG